LIEEFAFCSQSALIGAIPSSVGTERHVIVIELDSAQVGLSAGLSDRSSSALQWAISYRSHRLAGQLPPPVLSFASADLLDEAHHLIPKI
jgi:hypothetical protein